MSFCLAEEAVNEAAKAAEQVTDGRLRLNIGDNLLDAALGYVVVFIGLFLLMCVIIIVGKVMIAQARKAKAGTEAAPAAPIPAEKPAALPAQKNLPPAPGTAGEVKIYDTDLRDAAMIMAIVADKLQKPLNELRFVSIKEVK